MQAITSKSLWLCFLLSCFITSSYAQFHDALPRHANWGGRLGSPSPSQKGIIVRGILKGGFLDQMGIQVNDLLKKINAHDVSTPDSSGKVLSNLKGGTDLELEIERNGEVFSRRGRIPAMPHENIPGVVSTYKSVETPFGYKVQVILSKPKNAKGKLPGIFWVRWMSCNPVEKPVNRKGGVAQLLEDLAQKSGFILLRVEKTGLGDSEGPPCRNANFNEELEAHRAALKAFFTLEDLDTENVFIAAQSNGGGYAPLVGQEHNIKGYVVINGWAKTWYEHMLHIERNRFQLLGNSPKEVSQKMKKVTEFYYHYLIEKRSPGDILKEKPHLKEIWDFLPEHQYGLPISYMHQLQDLNLDEAWSKVKVPTLVMYGEYDWIMARDDHLMIVELINQNKPGLASFVSLPKIDHSLFVHDSRLNGFRSYWEGRYDPGIAKQIINWLKKVVKK